MAHLTARSEYARLVERLNRFPQGAPPSDLLDKILGLLLAPREAELLARVPIRPFTAERAARIWRLPLAEARQALDELASRSILLDVERRGRTWYALPPPMAGFFEFSMMRVRSDVDQKALSELFYQYLNVEEEFIRRLFTEGETQLGRVFVNESALPAEDRGGDALIVLDHERASQVIETAGTIGVGVCYCRHKMGHLGRACAAPLEICLTFGTVAESLTRHGAARRVEKAECRDLLAQARAHGLVQFGENVQREVSFICNCCGCCCEALLAARRFALLRPVHTTNFVPEIEREACTGCGRCVQACPVEAMALVSALDPHAPGRRRAELRSELCLGCGVCVPACRQGALHLAARPARVITPVDSMHRVVLMAIERGKLQNLIFDNQALASHRAMAAILGAILRLPPVKQALARRQLRSRYLDKLLERHARRAGAAA